MQLAFVFHPLQQSQFCWGTSQPALHIPRPGCSFFAFLFVKYLKAPSPPPLLRPAWQRPPAAEGDEARPGWWQKSKEKTKHNTIKCGKTKLQCLHKAYRKWKVPDLQTETMSKWKRIRAKHPPRFMWKAVFGRQTAIFIISGQIFLFCSSVKPEHLVSLLKNSISLHLLAQE